MKPFSEMSDEELEADDQLRQAARFRTVRRAAVTPGHVLAVMTCAGREALFERTLTSLNFNRWRGTIHLIRDELRVGHAQTFFNILRCAAAITGFQRLTMFEDDVIAVRNALDYIATTAIDDDLVSASWFHIQAPLPRTDTVRWMVEPASTFSRTQAVTLPARVVHRLLASEQLRTWTEPHGADMIFSQVMPDEPVAYHFPNLVDHVAGLQSLTGNTGLGARTSPTFPGENFDALDLTRTP